MKIKLIAVAALAVCGSGAFAATVASKCVAPATSTVDLVTACAPEVTLYMAGASAQQPAVQKLLGTTDAVFDLSKAIAKISKTTGAAVAPHANATAVTGLSGVAVTTEAGLGAKNTEIYVGTGSSKMGAAAGKRIAVVFNTANGSFAGVKQMTEAKDTNGISGSVGGELASQGLVTAAMAKAGTTLSCVRTSATDFVAVNGATAPTIPSYSCAGNAFNYVTTVPAGGVKGVQLALADVAPNQAAIGVLTAGKWTAPKFPLTVTGMQGFGVMVNDKALQALIKREVAAGRMGADCLTIGATNGTTSTLTAACQPNLSHADMAALITGRATAALISGDAADTTAIAYSRRVDFSGTQASSNIEFGGQAATEGFKAADIIAKKVTPTGFLALSDAGVAEPVTGQYTKTSTDGKFITNAKVGSGDVITAVSADTTNYAFGVVSLEKVWKPVKADSALKGASWVKIGGISPNFKADGSNDTTHRFGMLNGYPFQFEMVAIKNATNSKYPAIAAVVDGIVAGMQDPAFNLAGIAYINSSDTTKNANFTRGGLGNNYAPLSVK